MATDYVAAGEFAWSEDARCAGALPGSVGANSGGGSWSNDAASLVVLMLPTMESPPRR